jgi:hypothetical protein
MIRTYQGHTPIIPENCYVDVSAQVLGDVALGMGALVLSTVVGLAIAATVFKGVFGSLNFSSPIPLPPRVYAVGFGIAVLLGALSASIPAATDA